MNFFHIVTAAESLGNIKQPVVVNQIKGFFQFFIGKFSESAVIQTVNILLQGTQRLHQGALKVCADTHNFARGFHLGCQCPFGADKFIKRPLRNFDNTVVQRRLKTGIGLSGHRIFNLIQRITEGNLRGNLGNRITGCFGSQS